MRDKVTALLVSEHDSTITALGNVLEAQGLRPRLVRRVSEAGDVLKQSMPPAAVFSGTALDDGTWADVVFLAKKASKPVPVIVVSPDANVRLHISALENGAADFIVPPFGVAEIAHVLRCAMKGRTKTTGRYGAARVAVA